MKLKPIISSTKNTHQNLEEFSSGSSEVALFIDQQAKLEWKCPEWEYKRWQTILSNLKEKSVHLLAQAPFEIQADNQEHQSLINNSDYFFHITFSLLPKSLSCINTAKAELFVILMRITFGFMACNRSEHNTVRAIYIISLHYLKQM